MRFLFNIKKMEKIFTSAFRQGGDHFLQQIGLPGASRRDYSKKRTGRVWEHKRDSRNIRTSEFEILCVPADCCAGSTDIFEIGTFDGPMTRHA